MVRRRGHIRRDMFMECSLQLYIERARMGCFGGREGYDDVCLEAELNDTMQTQSTTNRS
jgi:hypothetical protein